MLTTTPSADRARDDYAVDVQETAGGYIVAGTTYSFGQGGTDAWVLRLDGNGNVVWQKTYGGSGDDFMHGGAGADQMTGSDGVDRMYGDVGNDNIAGGNDNDHIFGGTGDDSMDGNAGADIIYGGDGQDRLTADVKDDRLIDWFGNFNLFVVPGPGFGAPTIIRSPNPQMQQFLLNLGAGDGATDSEGELDVVTPPSPDNATTWRPGWLACAPIPWGSALAMLAWVKEPSSRR